MRTEHCLASHRKRWVRCAPIAGQAMCANSKTRWSVRRFSVETPASISPIFLSASFVRICVLATMSAPQMSDLPRLRGGRQTCVRRSPPPLLPRSLTPPAPLEACLETHRMQTRVRAPRRLNLRPLSAIANAKPSSPRLRVTDGTERELLSRSELTAPRFIGR